MPSSSQAGDRLESLLAGITLEAYASSAMKLAEEFGRHLSIREARVYDTALLHLTRAEPIEARIRLSQRLAHLLAGPTRTVTDLAYDLDAEVAIPVLRQSVLLQEHDLIAIAHTRSQKHLGALAERCPVSASVTDVLVVRGYWPVLRQLAANRTAQLSQQGLARLTILSSGDGHITIALTKRSDVPSAAKQRLLTQFKEMVSTRRGPLSGEHSAVKLGTEALRAIQVNTDLLSAERIRAAEVYVDAHAQPQPFTSAEVSTALDQGRLAEAIVIIARLAGQKPETFVRALRGLSPVQNLALLMMRSADLSWTTAERVLRKVESLEDRKTFRSALNLASQRDAYAELACQSARCVLQVVRFI